MVETLYRYGWGAPSEIDLGTTGSGKSERIRKRLVVERWTSFVDPTRGVRRGVFISMLHDPKRMESYAEFRRALHAYGMIRDDAWLIVNALLREAYRRYDFLSTLKWVDAKGRQREGGRPWNPLVHGPIISMFWDEFHQLATWKEFIDKLEELARIQRAAGMRVTIASHMATLGDTGSQALRDMLAGGRAVLLRTTSGLNASLTTGGQLTGDPRSLPKQPGMCFVAEGETATLIGRESYIPTDEQAEALGVRSLYDWLFDDNNQPIGYPAEIPPETADAFGREFMEWAAAGRQFGGRPVPVLGATRPVPRAAGDGTALDALLGILAAASQPLDRPQIAAHPQWGGRNVTSTMTAALRAGQESGRVVKTADGRYRLSDRYREQIAAERSESGEAA
jgi:hypothetical protein